MAMWWKKKLPLAGSALFRGDLPPQPAEFAFLEQSGIRLGAPQTRPDGAWAISLVHPEWGEAVLMHDRDIPLPPRDLFVYNFMSEDDRNAAISSRSIVFLTMESHCEHVLRDRKLMLRFLRAIMGDDGVAVLDHMAQKVWTRDDLDEELCHDADLDVEGIISLHAISDDDERIFWVHTHGLAKVGAFDIDVFEPGTESLPNIQELFRVMAFAALEGSVGPSTAYFPLAHPGGGVRLVEMDQFLKHTDRERAARLGEYVDDAHRRRRSVLCDPEASFIKRIFGRGTLRPVSFLSRGLPENPIFSFSNAASDLMAERARRTYPMLQSLRGEFAEFDFPCLAKLGFDTDPGSETSREHMWFLVHELGDDSIDCTLTNKPYGVSRLREGDRGRHPVDILSDWVIFTPMGMINPRSTTAARMVRACPDVVREMMKDDGE